MLEMPLRRLIIVAALALAMTGCSLPTTRFETPKVSLINLALQHVNMKSQEFLLDLRVENPNPYGLDISGVDADLALEGRGVAHGQTRQRLHIPAAGTAKVQVGITTHLLDSLGSILQAAAKQKAAYSVSGSVDIIGKLGIPFQYDGELDLSKLSRQRW